MPGASAKRTISSLIYALFHQTLLFLCCNKRFDELICRLRVQTERVLETEQFWALVKIGPLEAVAIGVEVLFYGVECSVEHSALFWRERTFVAFRLLQ